MVINEKKEGDSGYVGFYNGQRIEFYASTLSVAKIKAVSHFKPSKSKQNMVSVHLAERADGTVPVHTLT